MALEVVPLTLKQLNEYVAEHHRHHGRTQGHRFSLGCLADGVLVGACSVGRPVAMAYDPNEVAEVTRLVTNGTKNACSILYAAAARACLAMGFTRIQTYILDSEPGTSLRASGWEMVGVTSGGGWDRPSRPRNTTHPTTPKQRWEKILKQ